MVANAYTQVGFFTTYGMGCYTTQFFMKAFHNGENLATKRHIAANEIAYRAGLPRETTIAASHDPVELFGKPAGTFASPLWQDVTTHSQYPLIFVAAGQLR